MRLNQVTIGSTDLDRAERFYRMLGLQLIVIYFECDDVDAEYRRLHGSVEFTTAPADMPWLWREARLSDPDGHPLCLYAAGEARRNPPWRLDRSDQ